MTFRSRIGCAILAAGLCASCWAQDKPLDKPQDQTKDQSKDQSQQNKPAAPQQPSNPDEIVVNPISTNIAAQADATKLDAKYQVAAPHVALSSQHLTNQGHMLLLRGLQAEFVFLRRTFPFSEVGLTLKANTNQVGPDPQAVQREIATHGAAARPGDRGQITDVVIKDHTIVFELNGGPKKKSKWYQRIQVGGSSGMATPIPGPDNTMAHGSYLTLDFDKFVPELSVAQVKQLLAPVFDFSSVSATQAYADIMPPKVKAALKDHKALVGMTREMVINAKGRPDQKIRETDAGSDYEEWVYGKPPQTVEFVRFVGDDVVQIKDMPMGGERVVRTEREVDFPPGQVPGTAAAVIAQSGDAERQAGQGQPAADGGGAPAGKPTLRRAGEPEIEKGTAPLPNEIKRPPINRTPSSDPTSDSPGTPLPGPPLPGQTGPPGQQTPGMPPQPGIPPR
jgi:hypothetical protein